MHNSTAPSKPEDQDTPKPIPGSCSIAYRRYVAIQTSEGPATYWGEMENGKRHGKGTTQWKDLSCEHSGLYANGAMDGPGYLRVSKTIDEWSRFVGTFKQDCPTIGVWQEVIAPGFINFSWR